PLAVLAIIPTLPLPAYMLHIMITVFIFAYIAMAWAMMGRFGLLSLGHGTFMGIGAYTSSLLFNYYGLTPWVGMLIGGVCAALIALAVGFPSFRYGVTGAYFALLTLALSEIVRLVLIAAREVTGGELGLTLAFKGHSPFYFQFLDERYFYYISLAFWLLSILVWLSFKNSKLIYALRAIADEEEAAAQVGVGVTKYKLMVTSISAFLTAMGGTVYAQYLGYISPGTVSGAIVSLVIAYITILGGIHYTLGPFVGALVYTTMLEALRVSLGVRLVALWGVIFGLLLIVFILALPAGLCSILEKLLPKRWRS
ncbi:MAG: branched-chain amino acid ABC transporter permease, partial [Thermoproteota archaeon]